MQPAETFRRWVSAPARTGEELYPVELLLNRLRGRAEDRIGPRTAETLRALQADFARRAQEFRFEPRIEDADLDLAEESWDKLLALEESSCPPRPVRDLSLVRFLPQLTDVSLTLEETALTALAGLPRLARLTLSTGTLFDFSVLGSLPTLESLTLTVACAWPTGFDALAKLPRLREIVFRGNLLVWQDVAALPAVRSLVLTPASDANTPLPSFRDFPAAPELQTLTVGAIAELSGVQRFAELRALDLGGPFADLRPLATLRQVRKLRLAGEQFLDLAPVAQMPRLRSLELDRQRGLELGTLLDAPNLREVAAPRCEVLTTELASLNVALGKVDQDVFLRKEPRPLAPLRLLACEYRRDDYASLPPAAVPAPLPTDVEDRAAVFGDDPAPPKQEQRWMRTKLCAALSAVFLPGWGHVRVYPTSAMVVLRRPCDITLLDLAVQATRAVAARSRFAWSFQFNYDPGKEFSDPEPEEPRESDTFDATRAKETWQEHRRRRAERQEQIDREHRARLGLDPVEPKPALPADADEEDDADGLLTEAFTGTPGEFSDCEEDEGDELDSIPYMVELEEPFMWVHPDYAEIASRHCRRPAEDWHELPEPPAQRPRRR